MPPRPLLLLIASLLLLPAHRAPASAPGAHPGNLPAPDTAATAVDQPQMRPAIGRPPSAMARPSAVLAQSPNHTLNPDFDERAWREGRLPGTVRTAVSTVTPVDWPVWALGLAAAFLAGSIPFGLLIGRAKGIDIRQHGSGNIGATNVGRVLGGRYFALVFTLDMLKGLIPTLGVGLLLGWVGPLRVPTGGPFGGEVAVSGFWMEPHAALLWLAVMAATVMGHMFTPFAGFKGGKGVATGLGGLLGLFPVLTLPGLGALAVFLTSLGLWRFVSLSSCLAASSLPLWAWLVFAQVDRLSRQTAQSSQTEAIPVQSWPWVVVAALLGILVIYKHRSNIARLMAGTENRVGAARPPAPAAMPPDPTGTVDPAGTPIGASGDRKA